MKTKLIAAAIVVLFTFTLIAQQQPKSPGVVEPDAKIIAKLSEIVQVRKQIVEHYQVLYEAGQTMTDTAKGWQLAEVELIEARVDLAREQGGRDAVITELKGLVATREKLVERAQKLHNAARASNVEIERAQVALLEAQVRLLREQK